MDPPPTMRQIAARAGVDRSTVSLALRNDPRIKPETRERVQALAREMGYQVNPVVSSLMTQLRAGQERHFQSTLGFLNFGNAPAIEQRIWDGAEQRAKSMGYGLDFFQVHDFLPQRLEQILINRGVRGVIINSLWGITSIPPEYSSLWLRLATCCLGIHPKNPKLHFVADDNYNTALMAVEELANRGFSRIGLAMHAGINIETEFRFVGGYLAGNVATSGLANLPIFYQKGQDRNGFLSWFRQVKPQVIICIQEEILSWLTEAGYSVPRHVSLVHLDLDVTRGNWSGMRQGRTLRGKIAVDLLISQIIHNETGVPTSQIATLTESTWEPGSGHSTLASPASSRSRLRKPVS